MKNKVQELKVLLEEEDETKVVVFNTLANETSLAIERNGHLYRLTSEYSVKKQVDLWMKNYLDMNPFNIYIIYGLANGEYIRRLKDQYPKAVFIIYEPSVNVVKVFLNDEKNLDLVNCDSVFLGAGNNGKKYIYTMMETLLNTMSYKNSKWIVTPGYYSLYQLSILEIYKKYLYFMRYVMFNNNTKRLFDRELPYNILSCFEDIMSQYSFSDLKEEMQNHIDENSVAILVSAGPSLDKNINQLKAAENKAFIIAVDTALRTLSQNNIVPNMTITIDPEKPVSFFETKEFEYMPLILETSANINVIKRHKGKRFYLSSGDEFTQKAFSRANKKMTSILTGGSVANSAFSVLQELGFKKIILIGQDLAFTDGIMHTRAAHDNQNENKAEDTDYLFEVEGLDGNPIVTRGDYDTYRKWFELQMEVNPNLQVINATAVGARIHGMRECEFKTIFDEWNSCQREIDYSVIIEKIKCTCTETDKELIINYLKEIPKRLKKYKKRLENGIKKYKKLDSLKKDNKTNTVEFYKIYSEISKTNKWINTIEEIGILSLYESYMENEIDTRIYEILDDDEKEWTANIYLGINTYNLFIKRIDDFKEDFEKIFGRFLETYHGKKECIKDV